MNIQETEKSLPGILVMFSPPLSLTTKDEAWVAVITLPFELRPLLTYTRSLPPKKLRRHAVRQQIVGPKARLETDLFLTSEKSLEILVIE